MLQDAPAVLRRLTRKTRFDLEAVIAADEDEGGGEIIMPTQYKLLTPKGKAKAMAAAAAKAVKAKAKAAAAKGTKSARTTKTAKAAKTAKAVAKKKKKQKGKKKTQKTAETEEQAKAEDLADLIDNDPITPYLTWDTVNPPRAKMLNKVHSKVWHGTRNKMLRSGASMEDAKLKASKDAEAAKQRFLRAMGMA